MPQNKPFVQVDEPVAPVEKLKSWFLEKITIDGTPVQIRAFARDVLDRAAALDSSSLQAVCAAMQEAKIPITVWRRAVKVRADARAVGGLDRLTMRQVAERVAKQAGFYSDTEVYVYEVHGNNRPPPCKPQLYRHGKGGSLNRVEGRELAAGDWIDATHTLMRKVRRDIREEIRSQFPGATERQLAAAAAMAVDAWWHRNGSDETRREVETEQQRRFAPSALRSGAAHRAPRVSRRFAAHRSARRAPARRVSRVAAAASAGSGSGADGPPPQDPPAPTRPREHAAAHGGAS